MLPVYPGRSVRKNQRRAFFSQPLTLLCRVVKKCKLHVHGHDVCNIAPPTCISVNFVEIPLNFIRSNIHKTVILYKTVQSLCSDVVVQNVNVIPLVACEVVSFKKHHDDSLVKCFMLKSSPFAGHHQYYYRHYHHYCHHHYHHYHHHQFQRHHHHHFHRHHHLHYR